MIFFSTIFWYYLIILLGIQQRGAISLNTEKPKLPQAPPPLIRLELKKTEPIKEFRSGFVDATASDNDFPEISAFDLDYEYSAYDPFSSQSKIDDGSIFSLSCFTDGEIRKHPLYSYQQYHCLEVKPGVWQIVSLTCFTDKETRIHPVDPQKYYYCAQVENEQWKVIVSTCANGTVFDENEYDCVTVQEPSSSSTPEPTSGSRRPLVDPDPVVEEIVGVRSGPSLTTKSESSLAPEIPVEYIRDRSFGGEEGDQSIIASNLQDVFGQRCYNFIHTIVNNSAKGYEGVCMRDFQCYGRQFDAMEPAEKKLFSCNVRGKESFYCCVVENKSKYNKTFIEEYLSPNRREPEVAIPEAPEGIMDICGEKWTPGGETDLLNFYSANETAADFERKGFNITDHRMDRDRLLNFKFSNGSYTTTYEKFFEFAEHYDQSKVTNGQPARREVSTYVALIGSHNKGKPGITFHCDGVLINYDWVLTSAHCFRSKMEVIRLGEIDKLDSARSATENPEDYGIKTQLKFPAYRNRSEIYHDLALLQLDRTAFRARPDINPICLPWGNRAMESLVNKDVTLTGFGGTYYGDKIGSAHILEANITIYDIDRCNTYLGEIKDEDVSRIVGNADEKFPMIHDMNQADHILLCAANNSGGDSCGGDSGGPIVYSERSYGKDRHFLAGLVSSGYGCGNPDFPGIYVKISNPHYLDWIKRVAFS